MTKNTNSAYTVRPSLKITRIEAQAQIQAQIEKGKQLQECQINNPDDLKVAKREYEIWHRFNHTMLKMISDNDYLYLVYEPSSVVSTTAGLDWQYYRESFYDNLHKKVVKLESVLAQLPLIPENFDIFGNSNSAKSVKGNKVFVVHGHDLETRQAVTDFLEKLKLQPIVLQEQVTQGRTIIESFEEHSDVGFAVVLLTPDDQGSARGKVLTKNQYRARQNVILEWGFFIGKLGRENVCALIKGNIELPSDLSGVLYHRLDDNDWKFKLGRELKAAEMPVDANGLF